MEQMIEKILTNGWLSPTGWLLLEHDKYHSYTDDSNCFFSKAYGRTTVSIFSSTSIRFKIMKHIALYPGSFDPFTNGHLRYFKACY